MLHPERSWSRSVGWWVAAVLMITLGGTPAQSDTVELPGLTHSIWFDSNERDGEQVPSQSLSVVSSAELADADAPDFRPPLIEFPKQEFSFSLVEYSTPLRVAQSEMLFRFELPGVGRALVSCEFVF